MWCICGSLNPVMSTRLAEIAANSSDELSPVNSLFSSYQTETMYCAVKVIWTSEVLTMASFCDDCLHWGKFSTPNQCGC